MLSRIAAAAEVDYEVGRFGSGFGLRCRLLRGFPGCLLGEAVVCPKYLFLYGRVFVLGDHEGVLSSDAKPGGAICGPCETVPCASHVRAMRCDDMGCDAKAFDVMRCDGGRGRSSRSHTFSFYSGDVLRTRLLFPTFGTARSYGFAHEISYAFEV